MLPNLHYGRPHFWRDERSGQLIPVVERYFNRQPLSPDQVTILVAYLKQWILAPGWAGHQVDELRASVDTITTRDEIDAWVDQAADISINPF